MIRKIISILFLGFGILCAKAQDTDISKYDDVIFVENQTSKAGQKIVVPVMMNNTSKVTAFQFLLYLPETVDIAKNEKGKALIKLADDRTDSDSHFVSYSKQDDGAYKILVMSSSNSLFSGNTGTVLNITLNISDDATDGKYTIKLANEQITTRQLITSKVSSVKSTLTIASIIPGDVDNNGKVNILDLALLINYLNGGTPPDFDLSAADVNSDSKLSIEDVISLSDLIIQKQR